MSNIVNQLPPDLTEVDVIIAGGGTAGCVVAARLSDADPNLSILVIESGPNNLNNPAIVYPLLVLSNWVPTSKTMLFYQGSKESQLGDREMVLPCGGVLGGGSCVNLMTYSRAQRSDFDAWKTPGWSADEMLPYLQKLETYHGPGTAETHGYDGPIHITRGTYSVPRTEKDFIDAAAQVGWPEAVDVQDLDTNNALQRTLRYIGPDGKRQDAAHRYLHPRIQDGNHTNLHVLVENQVVRILFEDKKAVGVEFQPNPLFHGEATARSVKAKRLVVVSCGALGTPLVLERSGVGDTASLARAGVSAIDDVPGVGHNYMDHHLLAYPYRSSLLPNESADGVFGGRVDVGQLIQTNDSILGWNACDVTGKVRPSEADVSTLGPDFQTAWDRDYKNIPDKPLIILTSVNAFPGSPIGVPVGQYISGSTFAVYPYSRGHIHITGPGMSDPIDFQTGYLSDAHNVDVKVLMWSYKKQREIFRRMDVYRGEFAPGHPPFPPGSNAVCIETDGPLRDMQDLVYTEEDDIILEKWLRENVNTTWHSMGTCKMAPREEMGVVDPTLSVYGVKGLKIADLSISPSNVAANTANLAFCVGEKAADMFIKELGLVGK